MLQLIQLPGTAPEIVAKHQTQPPPLFNCPHCAKCVHCVLMCQCVQLTGTYAMMHCAFCANMCKSKVGKHQAQPPFSLTGRTVQNVCNYWIRQCVPMCHCVPMCANVCIVFQWTDVFQCVHCVPYCAFCATHFVLLWTRTYAMMHYPFCANMCKVGQYKTKYAGQAVTCMTYSSKELDGWYSTQARTGLSIFELLCTKSIKQLTNWVQALQWSRLGAGQTSAHIAKNYIELKCRAVKPYHCTGRLPVACIALNCRQSPTLQHSIQF